MTQTRVLVVEDEFVVGEDIKASLDEMGFDVLSVVTTGEAAIEAHTTLEPDFILMEVVLKGEIDGVEAATQIRAKSPTPILFLTAYLDDDDTLKRFRISEPYGFLGKPFHRRELKASIEIVLYKSQKEKEIRDLLEDRAATIERLEMTLDVVKQLEKTLDSVKQLSGFLPICSSCRKIRDEDGNWITLEMYVRENSEAQFTHSFCTECFERLYPELGGSTGEHAVHEHDDSTMKRSLFE